MFVLSYLEHLVTLVMSQYIWKQTVHVVEGSCPLPERGQPKERACLQLHATQDIPCGQPHMDTELVTSCV